MDRQLRSGRRFSPYDLDTLTSNTATDLDLVPLLKAAITLEDARALEEEDDSEGGTLSLETLEDELSDLTPLETSDTESFEVEPEGQIETRPSIPVTTAPPSKVEVARKKQYDKARRQKSRKAKATSSTLRTHKVKVSVSRKYVQPDSTPSSFNAATLPYAQGAYVGRQSGSFKPRPWRLHELFAMGYKLITWDGRDPHVITDSEQRVYVILAGQPKGGDWDSVVQGAAEIMTTVRREGERMGVFTDHRRGSFTAFGDGVSFGGGQKKPGNLVHGARMRLLLGKLKGNECIRRIAGFQSSAMAFYAPKLFGFYRDKLDELFDHHPTLRRNFPHSVFPASTFNLGPSTVCIEHVDSANVAHGFCPITSIGSYDPTKGGHIILQQPKLVIEFPPGSTILLPSSTLVHSNTPIQVGETRFSMTQYCAGGLIRWVNYGFRTAKSLLAEKGGKEQIERINGSGDTRWREGLSMFSKVDEIQADRNAVFFN